MRSCNAYLTPDGRVVELVKSDPAGVFVLQRHWWRGQIVIRFGPSSEHYDLRLRAGQHLLHLLLKDDPRQGTTLAYVNPRGEGDAVTTLDGRRVPVFDVRGAVELKPEGAGQPGSANPTQHTPAFLETVARGRFKTLEDSAGFKKWQFTARGFEGVYTLTQEDPDSDLWSFQKSEGPALAQRTVRLFKADHMQQIVWGVVMEPDEVDSQGHYATTAEIAEALHYFMLNWQIMDEEHSRIVPRTQAAPVEAFQAPLDLEWPVDDQGNTEHIKKGSWVMATKLFSDELWQKYLHGELNAYSIRGWGKERGRKLV